MRVVYECLMRVYAGTMDSLNPGLCRRLLLYSIVALVQTPLYTTSHDCYAPSCRSPPRKTTVPKHCAPSSSPRVCAWYNSQCPSNAPQIRLKCPF
jgi:hypothetical protein